MNTYVLCLYYKSTLTGGAFVFCKFCGYKITDNANFCPSCGKAFNEIPLKQSIDTRNGVKHRSQGNQKQGLATASLIFGIIALLSSFIPFITLPCALTAQILGKSSIKQKLGGKSNAKLGMKLANIAAIICAGFVILEFVVFLIMMKKGL